MEDVAILKRPSTARPARSGAPPFVQKYWAFLSYSHRDEADADWLHKTLEGYRVPANLVGKPTPQGAVPSSLAPVFRDRHELAASSDLGEDIRAALSGSRFLVVLCSPAAAASRWTNEEIRRFKALRPDGEVLAAIIAGEPWAADIAGHEGEECFPPALKIRYDAEGRPTGERAEPIAADLRESRDGRRLGFLKIVAGMLDVGLDELVQRDAQRRHRRMLAITAGSLTGMLVAIGLAAISIQARDEARDQRREAEGLVGFMLGDLRDRLEPIGRLDALDAVGARALGYFEKQDKGSLSDEALAQRSRALTLMGDIAQRRGNLDGALRRYREALASTSEALRRAPNDTQRLFDHAQNLFYFGSVAWQRGQNDEAAQAFGQYKALAERMVQLQPSEPKWQLERIYADTNLGLVLYDQRRYSDAVRTFGGSLGPVERFTAAEPDNQDFQNQLLETLAYLADANAGAGRLEEAISQRERQLTLLDRYQARRPGDTELRRKAMVANYALARLFTYRGDTDQAWDHARAARGIADELTAADPDNTEWAGRAVLAYFRAADVALSSGRMDEASALVRAGCDLTRRLIARDSTVVDWSGDSNRRCLLQRARVELINDNPGGAQALASQALANARAFGVDSPRAKADAAEARLIAGDAMLQMGNQDAALRSWRSALAAWPANGEQPPEDLALRALLLTRVGSTTQSQAIDGRLQAIGFRHPAYLKALQRRER